MKIQGILFFVVFLLTAGADFCPAKDTIRITTGEWPPYISQHLKHNGVVTHIIEQAFKKENITAEFYFFPWNRSKILTEKGEFDACSVWARLAVMEKKFLYSDTVIEEEFVFFHPRKIDFHWKDVHDLEQYKIGGVLGNIYSREIKQAETKGSIKIYYKPAELDVMKLLIHGNIEVFPVNRQVGYFLLARHFSDKEANLITHHPKPLRISQYCLIFSRQVEKNHILLQKFNKGLEKLKKSGRYDVYLAKSQAGKYR